MASRSSTVLLREFNSSDAIIPTSRTRIVYVSPLKALSNDIRKNPQEPLAGIRALMHETEGHEIDVRAEVRTGDTSAPRRRFSR
jgi:ATP-dependent helicase Lhr and Lhr-like helicase